MNSQEHQRVIRISDKVLAAILIQKGVEAVECFQQPPFFRMNYLFWDARKARNIIKKYSEGTYHFKLAECAEILEELLFEEFDRVQYIKRGIEVMHEK